MRLKLKRWRRCFSCRGTRIATGQPGNGIVTMLSRLSTSCFITLIKIIYNGLRKRGFSQKSLTYIWMTLAAFGKVYAALETILPGEQQASYQNKL